jgi:hypothetical protein
MLLVLLCVAVVVAMNLHSRHQPAPRTDAETPSNPASDAKPTVPARNRQRKARGG